MVFCCIMYILNPLPFSDKIKSKALFYGVLTIMNDFMDFSYRAF
jgi:hypothetical protein